MTARLRELLLQGFHRDNLDRLCRECEGAIGVDPALYGPLFLLFARLLDDTDPQGTPSAQIESYEAALRAPILALLENPEDSGVFRERLGEIMQNALAVLR